MNDSTSATVYLQVVKDPYYKWTGKVVGATQNKPERPKANAVVVKLTIRLPQAAFGPLEPTAIVDVPDSLIQHAIEVVALDANEGA